MSEPALSRSGWREAWAIGLIAICIVLLLCLFSYDWRDVSALSVPPREPPANFIGPFGAWTAFSLFMGFGLAAYFLPVWFLGFGLTLVFGGVPGLRAKIVWAAVFMASLCGLLAIEPAFWSPLFPLLNIDAPGGIPAQCVTDWMCSRVLGRVGTLIVDITGMAISVLLFFGWDAIRSGAVRLALAVEHAIQSRRTARAERAVENATTRRTTAPLEQPSDTLIPDSEVRSLRKPRSATPRTSSTGSLESAVPNEEAAPAFSDSSGPSGPDAPEERAPKTAITVENAATGRGRRSVSPAKVVPPPPALSGAVTSSGATYILPAVELLASPVGSVRPAMPEDAEAAARVIVDTLADFAIKVEVTHVEQGPTVTRYELVPASGVRLERISALAPNLQLNLKANSVRIQAPIPGRGTVGIEIPNASATMVYLSDVLNGPEWRTDQMELPLALGKDVGGKALVIDLASMPHLLIAGATGSGKTVCMNSILAGLLLARTPDEMHLMLVDPKIVEFAAYRGLPHLEGVRKEVITDSKKVVGGLRWAITEMERRYKLFSKVGVRNIKGFNTRTTEKQQTLFGGEEPAGGLPVRLPYIVIIVDELADLMLTAAGEMELYIARLAQMSRAVGIHMILATQRPSVNVITGTIKANFPARIAFQVAQKVDSRTILDTMGAEKLLGRGDMLYQSPGASRVVRAQGAYTTDEEIARIVAFIGNQCPAPASPGPVEPDGMESARNVDAGDDDSGAKNNLSPAAPPAVFDSGPATPNYEDMLAKGGDDGNEDSAMIEQSMQIIRETRRASTSMLQRRLRIGYTRAARIMDTLEERGIVGPARGSDPREILIDLDGDMKNHAAASGAATEENG
ncbi:MAG: DNA translocase FtsK [bacterium]